MESEAKLPAQLIGLKFFHPIQRYFDSLHEQKAHPNRNLHLDEYLSLLLLAYFNPAISGLRQLITLPSHKHVEGNLGLHHTSLGSFSEASSVFDPQPVYNIFLELSDQAKAFTGIQRPLGLPDEIKHLFAADATLWKLLPRMAHTLYQGALTRARKGELKGHFIFNVLDGVPVDIELTSGKIDERHVLPLQLDPGALYILDRGYVSRAVWRAILDAKSSFVARLKINTSYTVLDDLPLSEAAIKAGVFSDQRVQLAEGGKPGQILRVVKAKKVCKPPRNLDPKHKRGKHAAPDKAATEHELILLTDRFDLDAADVVALYNYRWQIEVFFRWFKCVMKCRHLFAETENGMALQIYAALIASLLVVIYTGRKPTKQLLFLLGSYMQGNLDWKYVEAEIAKSKPAKA
jgi:Transposase DDE domain